MRLSERFWFRWLLAAIFVVAMFSLPWALGHPPQEQNNYEPTHRTEKVEASVSPDERLADYTEALAWFTAALVIVSAFQVGLLIRADNTSKRVFELSERQFILESRQTDLAEKQHALARVQYVAANQPKLVIRSVSIDESGTHLGVFAEGHLITGDIVVTNIGNTDAMILESGYRFFITSDALPMAPPLEATEMLLVPNEPLLAHESRSVDIMGEPPGQEASIIGQGRAARWEIYLMGFIRFSDDTRRERYMGFCRIFVGDGGVNRFGGRFVPVENPDYEYSD